MEYPDPTTPVAGHEPCAFLLMKTDRLTPFPDTRLRLIRKERTPP